ncbi:hypothetical protein EDD16DRAFT_1522314 [Pisolithus croceorrhizus]|nr:hypothetical protein EDD16DRAFT_1522314 [Pisolithus croceorrhizus]
MKLTVENTTLRTAFQYLAGAISLRDVDPCQVDGTSFPQASMLPKPKVEPAPLTLNDYPLVHFWDQEDWDRYLELPEGQMSKWGAMGFLEDKDGKSPSCETVKAIHKLLCGGWVELVHQELAPPSWGQLSASTRQFIHSLMESTYPDFKLANNSWKLDYLASTTYPAWWKGTLDDNGKWKQKKGKWPKIKDKDKNDSMDEVGMKWKGLGFKSEAGPQKHFKGPSSFSNPLCDHVEESIQCDSDADPNAVSINPLSMGSNETASKARPILKLEDAILPIATSAPSATSTSSAIPPVVDNSMAVSVNKTMKGGSKAKMHPGPAKNGCCSLRCSTAQLLQAYDKEATALATSNTWDMKSICNGTLH